MIVIDVTRTSVSLRTARRFNSAALLSNALHFGSDLAGSFAVLVGLVFAEAGWPSGDSVAALIVAAMVLSAAVRLMRRNVDVLMDRAPADAEEAARQAIAAIQPPIRLKRLRMRSAAGRHFADVVIAVSPEAAVGQGHAAADAVEDAVERALPETDVVVHVEPTEEDAVTRELAYAAAMKVRRVREIHNISVLHVDGRTEVSLHLKLPGDSSLEEAHRVASEVEHAIQEALPGVDRVRTHLEPLAEEAEGRGVAARADAAAVTRASSRRRPERRRASSGSSRPTRDSSSSSRSGSTPRCRSPRRMRARARSRSASATTCPASRRSSSTRSRDRPRPSQPHVRRVRPSRPRASRRGARPARGGARGLAAAARGARTRPRRGRDPDGEPVLGGADAVPSRGGRAVVVRELRVGRVRDLRPPRRRGSDRASRHRRPTCATAGPTTRRSSSRCSSRRATGGTTSSTPEAR